MYLGWADRLNLGGVWPGRAPVADHNDDATVGVADGGESEFVLASPWHPLNDASREFAEPVEEARVTSVRLVGPRGPLTDITERVLDRSESSEHGKRGRSRRGLRSRSTIDARLSGTSARNPWPSLPKDLERGSDDLGIVVQRR